MVGNSDRKSDKLEAADSNRPKSMRFDAPHAVAQLLKLTENVDFEVKQLVEMANSTPLFAAEIIQEANAPQFRLRKPITKLSHAISFLGSRRIQRIALRYLRHKIGEEERSQLVNDNPEWSVWLRGGTTVDSAQT